MSQGKRTIGGLATLVAQAEPYKIQKCQRRDQPLSKAPPSLEQEKPRHCPGEADCTEAPKRSGERLAPDRPGAECTSPIWLAVKWPCVTPRATHIQNLIDQIPSVLDSPAHKSPTSKTPSLSRWEEVTLPAGPLSHEALCTPANSPE